MHFSYDRFLYTLDINLLQTLLCHQKLIYTVHLHSLNFVTFLLAFMECK
jgi:hypothetical protein